MAGSEGFLAVVVSVLNRPGWGKETGGGVNDKIGDGVRGGVGSLIERGLGRRGGVSGRERIKWSGMEWGGGRMSNKPRQTTGK